MRPDRRLPSDPFRPRRLATALVLLSLVVAACGTNQPTATPSASASASPSPTPTVTPATPAPATPAPSGGAADPSDAVYDEIEGQVVALRGLEPKSDVARENMSEERLAELIRRMYEEETPDDYIAANDRWFKAFGLIPADADLEDLTIELLSSGVAGFYRDDEQKLYVLSKSGAIGGNEKITFAHEYNHALQDQHFTVFKDQQDVLDQTDWVYARQAVYEGDATLLMSLWAGQHFTPQDMQDVLAEGMDPAPQELLNRMPAILRETLLYPYTTGLTFAQGNYVQGGWDAINAIYDDMPTTTEQILHADKFAAREPAREVTLPDDLAERMGKGWTLPLTDSFGELQTKIWLDELGATDPETAAAGWGGDRLGLLQGPDDAWVAILATDWDSAAEATEFEAAIESSANGLPRGSVLLPGEGGTVRWILSASDDDALERAANVLGLAG